MLLAAVEEEGNCEDLKALLDQNEMLFHCTVSQSEMYMYQELKEC